MAETSQHIQPLEFGNKVDGGHGGRPARRMIDEESKLSKRTCAAKGRGSSKKKTTTTTTTRSTSIISSHLIDRNDQQLQIYLVNSMAQALA
jgi:hypothetical protein